MNKKQPRIRKDDKVMVRTGKDKGKIGTILSVDARKGQAVVEKLNMVKRHSRPGPKTAQGGIIEKESPIHVSNLMIVCNKCAEPTRVGRRTLDDGKRVRVCNKCGESMDE